MKTILCSVLAGYALLFTGCVEDEVHRHHARSSYSGYHERHDYPERHYGDYDRRYDDDRSDHTDVRVRF